ncbi:biopolymer transporter ExbD [Burkholderia stabilis]|uniref:Biopolymer transport protein exbD,biopolymer transport protein ExbD,protein TolR,Biopolymer transport protein ExbD/TolR n=1 Tax=Burkholderia stabilis TaxID=95485 RepID=A0AAJ5T6N7_9BURK|nr:biopolymer transporter ExbD [Burkholderia stabilis]AOR70735.1 biopolymer transporter ExbD [Burkholderia stabilis]VBB14747.1 Biopolymer transport protein exbD,biopolymer transport protein ExbD,protein TolR,Biopolymer transport protein ExbD/TolR [Burkholderia stabilis]HDR9496091.1 biopolymer transporter ExbD [Burkholderia stabilis]HDR9520784.1 biopolymer transporter ExbD [Burkholderia stabilis]HDR9528535.1 biopolymer transporter ExbD [Burkholderia stabilis]
MAMSVRQDDDDEVIAQINTTPLVDVMLVLLIIFLITIPVVTHTIPLDLPKETVKPLQSQPKSIEIAVNRDGDVFWNESQVDAAALLARLKSVAVQTPQPDVHVRGDESTRYEFIGRVMTACERAGIGKVSFITEPPARGG